MQCDIKIKCALLRHSTLGIFFKNVNITINIKTEGKVMYYIGDGVLTLMIFLMQQ